MLHHEESPEKPQYNMATPPFCLTHPFSSKNFQTLPFPSILKKANLPPFMKGGGGGTNYEIGIASSLWTRYLILKSSYSNFPIT